ncbi:DUF1800 family protein [Caulobacter sp. UNC279MFTsu5.1]|uniref:DUF1800 domain-containing protein n=1 Tax=Caulobacter sp. UNC279MFTsu5.1 TaxID=1502775 RepID=UPI0008ED48D1|nr:DUF1800 family protein [Caulobacter sp. UNC279MFTsu5.1]SFJ75840.1 Uncharacterized conserved protein, DUF1800 family [Caulobacter sp. UNC279MFTsu5.1]
MSLPSNDMMAAIAATRFGLGARPGEIDAARGDPRGFLAAQIRPEGADQPRGGEGSAQRLAQVSDYQMQKRDAKMAGDPKSPPVRDLQKDLRAQAGDDFLARARLGAATDAAFRERWALFWANHFTVSSTSLAVAAVAGPFEQEAIRPHVFGRFEDLLVASSTHPAMLLYLDQAQSLGPDSRAAQYQRKTGKTAGGLNENLAREILELHTVGVDAGYGQADVTEFARAMTGFSVGRPRDPSPHQFLFRDNAHEPGARTVMGRRYPQDGQAQALAVMRDLAASPHTARHVATKLAAHFVSDVPPPALVARLEKTYLDSNGRLDDMARALVAAPEAWDPAPVKFKTPYEFAISTWRAVDAQPSGIDKLAPVLTGLGQKPFSPPSPKGWADEAQVWCAPDALIKRLRFSEGFAAVVADRLDPNLLAQTALGARLTPPVAKAVARAETRREAVALLLMSPEFQRR